MGSSRDEGPKFVSHTPSKKLQHLPLLKLLQRTGKSKQGSNKHDRQGLGAGSSFTVSIAGVCYAVSFV